MSVYRKNHITPWRSGWRYKRRVPKDAVAALGRSYWTKYLGAISEPDAIIEARKLDVAHDELIKRLKAMSVGDRAALATSGGVEKTQLEIAELAVALPFVEAVSAFNEADVSLEPYTGTPTEDGDIVEPNDAIEQLQEIRKARASADALRARINSKRTLIARTLGSSKPPNLATLIPVWEKVAAPRRKKSVDKKNLYVGRLVSVVGDLGPTDVRREHAVEFRNAMEKKGESRTNIKHMLEELRGLFNVALSENLVESNPFAGVKVVRDGKAKFSDERRRKPFTGSQVMEILSAASALDCKGANDLYWIIKLLAYHGARSGEICQLRPIDVMTIAGVPVLHITDEAGSLKNKFSRRDVPIHPECIGIVSYAAERSDYALLFSEFSKAKDTASRFQSWGSKFLDKQVGITDKDLSMHSLRHTWRTVAREIDMPEAISRSIMGHALGKDDHAAYGAGPSLTKRAEWMAKVDPMKA